jgi:hypothetical protein
MSAMMRYPPKTPVTLGASFVFATTLIGILLAVALRPGVATAQVSVAVVAPSIEGEVSPETAREVQDAVLAGIGPAAARTFAAAELEQARARLDAAGPPPADPDARLLEAARSLGAQALVRLRFGQAGQVYEVEAELLLTSDGRRLGSIAQSCQVCTWTEALATVARAGEGLRPSLPGIVAIATTPEGASLTIDGAAVAAAEPLALPPGRHRIEASLPEHATQSREVEVVSGARVEVQLALVPSPAVAPVVAPVAAPVVAPVAPDAAARARRARSLAIWGGVTAGLGVAALATGVVWLALEGRCEIGSQDIGGVCEYVYYNIWPQGLALTLVGAGLGVAAVVLFVMSRRARRAAPAVAPTVSAAGPDGGLAVGLAGRF